MRAQRRYVFRPELRGETYRVNLGPSSQKALDFIKSEVAAGRGFPSSEAIRVAMGWAHRTSAQNVVRRLAVMGHVYRPNKFQDGQNLRWNWSLTP